MLGKKYTKVVSKIVSASGCARSILLALCAVSWKPRAAVITTGSIRRVFCQQFPLCTNRRCFLAIAASLSIVSMGVAGVFSCQRGK